MKCILFIFSISFCNDSSYYYLKPFLQHLIDPQKNCKTSHKKPNIYFHHGEAFLGEIMGEREKSCRAGPDIRYPVQVQSTFFDLLHKV